MYRKRQFDKLSVNRTAELYRKPHRHDIWPDHVNRVQETISFAREHGLGHPDGNMLPHSSHGDVEPIAPCGECVADLSCGDATIPRALCPRPILGDFAPGYDLQGFIEETVQKIPLVDVFVCTETLEHIYAPDVALLGIRAKTRRLLLSTPVHNFGDVDHNPEHYHVWDREGVEAYLTEAGFTVIVYKEIHDGVPAHYRYGTWICQ